MTQAAPAVTVSDAAVWAALGTVLDPEIDEPVTRKVGFTAN